MPSTSMLKVRPLAPKAMKRVPRLPAQALRLRGPMFLPSSRARYEPVCRATVRAAVLRVLAHAPQARYFTSVTTPVWSGWAGAEALLWRIPVEIADAPLRGGKGQTVAEALGELLLGMAQSGLLEKRVCHPFRHNDDPACASLQGWEFRLPGDVGYCYWEEGRPSEMDSDWQERINAKHLAILMTVLTETNSDMPPYILARVERRWHFQREKRRILLF